MRGLMVAFQPLTGLLFRAPGSVYEAGLHGPGVAAHSLSYPLPSTVVGALSFLAYRKGLCKPTSSEDFSDHHQCLKVLLGGNIYIRPGLLYANGSFYAYLGSSRFVSLEALGKGDEYSRQHVIRARRTSVVGIALDRATKAVVEGMLYTASYVEYEKNASIAVLLGPDWNFDSKEWVMPLGGDTRSVHAFLLEGGYDPIEILVSGRSDKWEAILLTPALLHLEEEDGAGVGIGGSGETVIIDDNLVEEIAGALRCQSEREVNNCIKSIEINRIPRGELEAGILSPGWSVAKNAPREPHLLLPPDTRLLIEAHNECAGIIARLGLGVHSRLGWGTVFLRATR